MSSPYSRFRERLSAPPPANSVQIGVFEKRRKSDDKIVSTTSVKTGGGTKAMSILRCWDQLNQKVSPKSRRPKRRKIGFHFEIREFPVLDKLTGRPLTRIVDGELLPVVRSKRVKVPDFVYEDQNGGIKLSTHDKGYRDGGPFLTANISLPAFDVQGHGTYKTVPEDSDPSFYYLYRGGFSDPQLEGDLITDDQYQKLARVPGPTAGFLPSLDDIGSQAYARLRPQLEKAGLMVALREAKDIPRMLETTASNFNLSWIGMGGSKTSQLMHPKSVADNFLNHHFGWVPFIKDLRQFHDVFQNSEKYISQISRDNNSWIKRTRVMQHTETSVLHSKGGITGACSPWIGAFPWNMCRSQNVPGLGNVMAQWNIHEENLTHVWGTGLFKYYRPEFDLSNPDYSSQWNDLQRRLLIYGARISPSNVWKSTPWTWLIDWFSNVGDHIDLLNDIAIDGVVSKYMYVMRHAVRRFVLRTQIFYWQSHINLEWSRIVDTKQRQRAWTPYGFNLFGKDLSAKQWAILGALGVSSKIPMRP